MYTRRLNIDEFLTLICDDVLTFKFHNFNLFLCIGQLLITVLFHQIIMLHAIKVHAWRQVLPHGNLILDSG